METFKNIELIPASNLRSDNTIFEALKIIEDQRWMIITVVDQNEKLLGVASPGDLRKAILNGHSVYTPLEKVMNADPVHIGSGHLKDVANVDHILQDIKDRYGQTGMFYAMIPVLAPDQSVIGLVSLKSLRSYVTTPIEKLDGRTVLIVGGAGYIGSVLTRILLDKGWGVRVLDKLLYTDQSLSGIVHPRFSLIKGDAANIDDIVEAVEGVDAVVYLAELVGDPACSIAPQLTLKTNYLAVTSMAHLCSHLNINRFIYTSSCSVYGATSNPDERLTEKSPLQPVSLYARMKTLVEESILSVCHLPNPLFSPTILRLGTVFGYSYRPRFDLVVNIFAKNAIQKGVIEIHGGDQWRPNVHVSDVGQAILNVLNAPAETVRGQVFNVGSNEQNHTINGLGEIAKKVFPSLQVVFNNNVMDRRNYKVDFSKIEQHLGFKAQISVEEGMREIKRMHESNALMDLDSPHYSNVKTLQELNFV